MLTFLVSLLAAYGGLCLLAWVFQGRLVYFPDRSRPVLPPARDVAEVELVTSDGLRLSAWMVRPEGQSLGALVFCHGNAGNIGSRLFAARVFRDMGLTVLLFDYRGYGGSEGSPTEEGTYRDAEAAWDHLVAAGHERIGLYGESLGCGVALELALRRRVDALVLESAFTSIPDVGAAVYPWLPVRFLARVRYDNLARIAKLDSSVLLLHSPSDEIVPFEHAERLLRAAPEGTELIRTEGGHNDGGFLRSEESIHRVKEFLQDRLSSQRGESRAEGRRLRGLPRR